MEKQPNSIGFFIRKINTDQFAIVEDAYTDGAKTRISSSLNFGANAADSIVSVAVKCMFYQTETPFIIIEASCYFKIKPDNWGQFYNTKTKKISLPKGFATHLALLTVGTARGILHTKTENTPYNRFYLPTINLNELVKEDISLVI